MMRRRRNRIILPLLVAGLTLVNLAGIASLYVWPPSNAPTTTTEQLKPCRDGMTLRPGEACIGALIIGRLPPRRQPSY